MNSYEVSKQVIGGLTELINASLLTLGQLQESEAEDHVIRAEGAKERSDVLRVMRTDFEDLMAGVTRHALPPEKLPSPELNGIRGDIAERHRKLFTACVPSAEEARAFAMLHNWLLTGGDFPTGPQIAPAVAFFKRLQACLEYTPEVSHSHARANGG